MVLLLSIEKASHNLKWKLREGRGEAGKKEEVGARKEERRESGNLSSDIRTMEGETVATTT